MAEQWDGRPQNPEQDGLHYITDGVALWLAGPQKWALLNRTRRERPEWLAAQPWAEYRGPCPTLTEVEARVAAARREGIEALAVRFERMCDHWVAGLVRSVGSALLEDAPRAVADLKPTIRALDTARVAAARREGIEAAAKEIDCGCDIRDAVLARLEARGRIRASWLCRHGDVCCALQAAEIRALKWETKHD